MRFASKYLGKWLRESVDAGTYNKIRNLYMRMLGLNVHLRHVSGVIHVGANTGQESDMYSSLHLDVIWIEPIPEVFKELQSKISHLANQRAYQYLLTDVDGGEYTFHVANNAGQSSSIFDMAKHKEMYPEIHYSRDLVLRSTTLTSLLRKENIDLSCFQTLVLDTQGSELLVLKGAEAVLSNFQFIKGRGTRFRSVSGSLHRQRANGLCRAPWFQRAAA